MRRFIRGLVAAALAVTLSLATSVAAAAVAGSGTEGAVQSQQAFGEMRSYVLNLYQGVEVQHSYFADDSYFDCVVTEHSRRCARCVARRSSPRRH